MKTSHLLTVLLVALSSLPSVALSQENTLTVGSEGDGFCLFAGGKAVTVSVSPTEPLVVKKAAQLFADDVERVTGVRPSVAAKAKGPSVVIATLGQNDYVDKLVAKGTLNVADIRGGWERFVIRAIGSELFIVGSDRRGTAYGVVTLSEAIGVSPWYWWADVPVIHRDALYVTADYVSKAPSVKYRGIFINDEDWGLKPWASKNYERGLGDIGPRTYARVCELLLRLKANMLAPAMHSCTGAFYSHPESKVVADSFGIVITTSHCEPLLLNNAAKSEWDEQRDGDWNYKTNSETIFKKWDDRLAEAAQYENIYTVAMRGVHDAGLRGNLPMNERVPLIEKVITDQRALLTKHKAFSPRPDGGIPQIFVPYKETMDIYENGLRVPDDITLVWVDDNYGYMKRVSNPDEQRRSGRSGVYYHISYLGAPHDYLWICTTPPVLMYEELKKAYDTGADRYWLLNVGDIKPMELGIQTFMDMAWDLSSFNIDNVNLHQSNFLARLFGGGRTFGFRSSLMSLLDTYYRLAWSRKPEYMGWEYEWDDPAHTGLKSTEFSFQNYAEAQQRLADYQRISDEVERLAGRYAGTPSGPAFFQLVQFPVQAAYQMNRKFLMAQLNQELLAKGSVPGGSVAGTAAGTVRAAEANWAARQAQLAYDSINALNQRYNELLDGKWRYMMALPPGLRALYQQMPEVTFTEGAGEKPYDLTPRHTPVEGCYLLDLAKFDKKSDDTRLVNGLGYDWKVMQLGSPNAEGKASVTYLFGKVPSDTVSVRLSTVPFWPLHAGLGNRVAVSVDGGEEQVFANKFKEYSRSWKDQVMRNGVAYSLRFAIDKTKENHTVSFRAIDPGQMLQQAIIDWGGLLPSYIGPQNYLSQQSTPIRPSTPSSPSSPSGLNDIHNPMLWADVPDPDVIRVGDTFYLVSTTMHLMPGAPVMASKDLKNWETVGYIFDRLTDSPKYDLSFSLPLDQQKGEGVGTVYGRGQWATSLKYHDGRFWALLAPNEAGPMGDTYIFTAPKAEGPWTIHSRLRHFHDATLFFDDDGTPYVFFGTGEMCQLSRDLKSVVEGSLRHYFQREEDERGLLEGTRVIKHNGTYYALLISHVYAPGRHRREVCYRTKDLNGKWEKQTILESDFGGFSYLAQGTIVDTEEGDWYGIMFQDRGGVGRVLTLSPVRWIDGWPMLGDENGKVPDTMRPYRSGMPETAIVCSDDFTVNSETTGKTNQNYSLSTINYQLKKFWQWNHNPIDAAWSLTERPGFLRLKTARVVPNLYLAPNTLTQRMEGPTCSGCICIDVSKMKDGDCAGFSAFNGDSGVLTLKKKGKKFFLEMSEQKVSLTEREKAVTKVEEKVVETVELTSNLNSKTPNLYLRITGDFQPGHNDAANFFYSLDGDHWTQIGTKNYRMVFDYRRFFMGSKFAIFNYATKNTGGYIDVDYFQYHKD